VPFTLVPTTGASQTLADLEKVNTKKADVVKKALGYLQLNPHHNSLETHEFRSLKGPKGEKVFQAYAQNNTPNAWRILFYYQPKQVIVVVSIVPHPKGKK